jgi:hypothetical protein
MMRLRGKGEMKTGRKNERGNGLDNRRFLVERGSLFYFIYRTVPGFEPGTLRCKNGVFDWCGVYGSVF